jgi:hypothetical protein
MTGRRLLELLAIGMIGEAVAGFLQPRHYLLLWQFGPKGYRQWLEGLTRHGRMVRVLCLVELGAGLLLTWRETGNAS